MKQSIGIAILAGATMAEQRRLDTRSLGKLGRDQKFNDHTAQFNVEINTVSEYALRQTIYRENDKVIQRQNAKADIVGDTRTLRLAHNFTSTMTRDEYLKLLGADTEAANAKKTTLRDAAPRHKGKRHLIDVATNVDHFADGWMHSVKDQGGCGSCWAFAANTALEGTLAKKTESPPVRISEQQLVDCTLTTNPDNYDQFGKDYYAYGCEGGWMSWAWDFQIDQGNMKDSDYSYFSGTSGTEGACQHDVNKIEHFTKEYGQIYGGVDDMKARVMQQPVTVALDAGSSAFQFYSSGVVEENDGCGTWLNHAVVVVGYSDGSDDGDDSDDGDESDDDDSDDDDDDGSSNSTCTVEKWWHTCEDTASRRRLQDDSGDNNYWKVQNSWGSWWGDQGFIKIAISGGDGVCGINSVVEWVEVADRY